MLPSLPSLFLVCSLSTFCASAQRTNRAEAPSTLPPGTVLSVEIDQHLPMRIGTPVRAHLLYPVYHDSTLVLPQDTSVLGSVLALNPDRARRVHSRLNVDFTPFHTPVVRFTQIVLAGGKVLPLSSDDAVDGAPIFRIVAPPPATGSFLHRQFAIGVAAIKDRLRVVTAPDKANRLTQLLYSQLPYHPERIGKGTAWTIQTTQPLAVPPSQPAPTVVAANPAATDNPPTWMVQAYLDQSLSSESSSNGQQIKATVAEPIYNPDGSTAVPQGSVLTGTVTKSKPARRFSRAGALNFSFRQLTVPGGDSESVQASLKGADSASAADLAMNSEGEVKPKPQDKLIVPFLLLSLAARPLDRDHGDNMLGKDAVASNSLGFIGFLIGVAAQRPNLAAGIGYYGAALSIYSRIFARGKPVTFPRNTRIVLETTARRSTAIKPIASAIP